MAKKEIIKNDALTVRVNAEPVLDILEDAISTTEQTLDVLENQVENVVTVTKNNPLIIAGAFVLGAGIAGFVAYKYAQKRATEKYEEILQEEINLARSFHARLAKEGDFESPESAVQALVPENVVESIRTYQGRTMTSYNNPEEIPKPSTDPRPPIKVAVDKVEAEVLSVVVPPMPEGWDYDVEIALREEDPSRPYVISYDEHDENLESMEQVSITYYEGDDTLADEKQAMIDDADAVVGARNLLRFGEGSLDPEVVYVRNPRIGMDFEVTRSKGRYAEEVLGDFAGEDDEAPRTLRHAQRRRNRRQWSGSE